MRVTKERLEHLAATLNRVTGSPEEPWTRGADGKLTANVGCYHLSWAYGGVDLHQMREGGGVVGPLAGGYGTKRALFEQLKAMIEGVRVGREVGLRATR